MHQVKDPGGRVPSLTDKNTGRGLFGVLVERFLERLGCQIVGAVGNVADALQMIRTSTIDVAVIDGRATWPIRLPTP
jgi:DNA-binding NarL/FixJ family response regulator